MWHTCMGLRGAAATSSAGGACWYALAVWVEEMVCSEDTPACSGGAYGVVAAGPIAEPAEPVQDTADGLRAGG